MTRVARRTLVERGIGVVVLVLAVLIAQAIRLAFVITQHTVPAVLGQAVQQI